MKNYSQKLLFIGLVVFLTGCTGNKTPSKSENPNSEVPPSENSSEVQPSQNSSEVESSEEIPSSEQPAPRIFNLLPDGGMHCRLTDRQKTYIESDNYADTTPYSGNLTRPDVSYPVPVEFSWETENLECSSYLIDVYYGQEKLVSYTSEEPSFCFYNTEVSNSEYSEEYSFTVTALDENNEAIATSEKSTAFFTEARGPRHLYVDGVDNMRDLGGWGKIKQGLIFRSGRFNADKESEPKITVKEDGLYEIKNHFKIKTEIDLRRSANNEIGGLTDTSVLGEDVQYVNLPMYYGGKNILTFTGESSDHDGYTYDNPAMIKQFFEILADEDNYPLAFHCSIGKDRTGCLAYLVEGLLGFEQETMYRDYMFTNFSNAGYCKLQEDVLNRYGKTLDEYENGDTLQEKVYNYLNEVIGVAKNDLNSVRSILSSEVEAE